MSAPLTMVMYAYVADGQNKHSEKADVLLTTSPADMVPEHRYPQESGCAPVSSCYMK